MHNRIRYNCERFKIYNVVYLENIPDEYIKKDFLLNQLSIYGRIRKITINKYNNIHVDFYSNISAFLCIKYLNNFKLLSNNCLLKCSFCTTLTEPELSLKQQIQFDKKEPIRKEIKGANIIFPSIADHECNNINLINEFYSFKCLGTGGIYNNIWIDKINDDNIYFVPKVC